MVTATEPGPTARTQPATGSPPPLPQDGAARGTEAVPGVRSWCWDDRARSAAAAAGAVLLGLTAAAYAVRWLGDARAGTVLFVVACLAGAAGAVLGGLARGGHAAEQRRLGRVLLILAGAWGVGGAWLATAGPGTRPAALAAAVVLTLVLAGVSTPLGQSAFLGAGAVVVAVALWESLLLFTDARGAGVVLGAVAAFALGLLPRLALQGAGLLRLDDQRARGASVSAHEVDTALAANHRVLALATVTAAACATAGGWLALSRPSPWSVGLALLLAALLLSRARAYPLTVEVLALTGAAAVLLVRLVVLWGGYATVGPLTLFAVLLAAALAVLVVRVPEGAGTVLRKAADLGESACVVLLLPVVVGAFGVFGQLLTAF